MYTVRTNRKHEGYFGPRNKQAETTNVTCHYTARVIALNPLPVMDERACILDLDEPLNKNSRTKTDQKHPETKTLFLRMKSPKK
jgi:hypothetical protein